MPRAIQHISGLKRPRALLLDLDGTLLAGEEVRVRRSLRPLLLEVDAQIPITIATGRYRENVSYIASEAGLTAPHISENGARIFDGASGRDLHQSNIACETARELLNYAERAIDLDSNLHYLCVNGRTVYNSREMTDAEYAAVTALTIWADDKAHCEQIVAETRSKFDLSIEISRGTSGQYFVVFTPPGVNKGYAALKLARLMGASPADLAVIGDGPNDIPMFEVAGLSIAMGNAAADVRAKAGFVAPPQSEDGLAIALRCLLALR